MLKCLLLLIEIANRVYLFSAFGGFYVATKFDHELMSTDLTVVKDQRH